MLVASVVIMWWLQSKALVGCKWAYQSAALVSQLIPLGVAMTLVTTLAFMQVVFFHGGAMTSI
jgi:hypothetical protein